MKWTIAAKISVLMASTVTMFLILEVLSLRMMDRLNASTDLRRETFNVIKRVDNVFSLLKDAETGQRGYVLTGNEEYLQPYNLAVKNIDQEINDLLELMKNNQEQLQRLNTIKSLAADKFSELRQTIELRKLQGFNAALEVVNTNKGIEIMDDIRAIITDLEKDENRLFDSQKEEVDNNFKLTRFIVIYGSAVIILLNIIIAYFVIRSISLPLKRVTMIASNIASNDLSVVISPTERQDEVGVLQRAFRRMTDNLRRSLSDISEGVNLLGSSANEILAAATQVSTGTAETATAINETTTTVEEVQQAAKQSAEIAKNVTENSTRVVQISQTGQKAAEGTVEVMKRIREQMETIAQTIVRLSEQSQSIGGIIASVTDIADQSNLLAVNAAIEAAKAGEQGKGFSVVAQEIKNLAEQSKQSTAQVRNILNDVQKATSAAVLATEQGAKAVENGVKQSAEAGEAIKKLTDSSNEAVKSASQIVASSQQQVIGMDQIGIAMQNINQAATETAVSMGQSEKSAESLNGLGLKLKSLVEQFKM